MSSVRILFLGDIIGRPGRTTVIKNTSEWKEKFSLDSVIINGENASGGNGLTIANAEELFNAGVDVITSGNHIWKQKEYPELLSNFPDVIRPANYPDEVPGRGYVIYRLENSVKVAVINLQGRVFMDPIDCPFRKADELLSKIADETNIILVDFHAEATSEKIAMGHYLDGRVSAVLGTHTHVPTADGKILPNGTAYQTDLGMTGPSDGVIGVAKEPILLRFLTGLPARFSVADGTVEINGAILTIDTDSGKALEIERFSNLINSPE